MIHCLLGCPQGAEEMGEMEHYLNVYCSRKAKHSVADFLGFCEVAPEDARKELTAGVWLVRARTSCTLRSGSDQSPCTNEDSLRRVISCCFEQ